MPILGKRWLFLHTFYPLFAERRIVYYIKAVCQQPFDTPPFYGLNLL